MKLNSRLVAYGVCSVLILGADTAFAQNMPGGELCTGIKMLRNECGSQSKKPKQEMQTPQQASTYPNATRPEPKDTKTSQKEGTALDEGLNAANSGDIATAQKDLQPIADSSDSKYAKALALMGLAQAKYNSGDTKGAIVLQKQSLDLDALPNNNQFDGMYRLAQMYVADEDYASASSTLDQWMQQGRKETAEAYALKGNILYRLEKYPEAVAAIQKAKSLSTTPKDQWDQILMASYTAMDKYDEAGKLAEQMLAKDPNNPKLLMNAVTIYTNAKQYDKALVLLERARANGQITDETNYLNMAKLYFNIALDGKNTTANANKATQVIEEGMGKGIVKPSSENYKLLGDAYKLAGDTAKANAAYDKAGVPHAEAHKGGKKK